jgi:hypothetical protein
LQVLLLIKKKTKQINSTRTGGEKPILLLIKSLTLERSKIPELSKTEDFIPPKTWIHRKEKLLQSEFGQSQENTLTR